jgi:hypothetical protein
MNTATLDSFSPTDIRNIASDGSVRFLTRLEPRKLEEVTRYVEELTRQVETEWEGSSQEWRDELLKLAIDLSKPPRNSFSSRLRVTVRLVLYVVSIFLFSRNELSEARKYLTRTLTRIDKLSAAFDSLVDSIFSAIEDEGFSRYEADDDALALARNPVDNSPPKSLDDWFSGLSD